MFTGKWVRDSIKENELLNFNHYLLGKVDSVNSAQPKKRTRFTITEIIKMIALVETTPWVKSSPNSLTFWRKMKSKNELPGRTEESLKTMWRQIKGMTIEECIIDLLAKKTAFSQ